MLCFAGQNVPLKMDGVTPAERCFRTFPVSIREFCFLHSFLASLKLQFACEFLGYPRNPVCIEVPLSMRIPRYLCNPACRGWRSHVNSQRIRAILFVKVEGSMWIPTVSVHSCLSRSKDPSEFLGYACTPACRGRRIHMNSKGIRAVLLVEVEGFIWILEAPGIRALLFVGLSRSKDLLNS